MAKPTWLLTVKTEFCAAHALRNYNGKCERLHGHNYAVDVVVKGHALTADTELLMDFSDLKALLKTVLADMDHRFINEVVPFDSINPSSENIARHIYQQICTHLPAGVRVHAVTVAEKDIQSATYMEDDTAF